MSVTIDFFFTDRGLIDENGIPALNISRIREGDIVPHYIKLHGSIDWWLTDQQKVIAILLDQVLTDRTIIYPIYEKYVTKDPFFTLNECFGRTIFREDIVVVIGYSFRDVTINNTFLDWLASKPESRLIIVARKNQDTLRR